MLFPNIAYFNVLHKGLQRYQKSRSMDSEGGIFKTFRPDGSLPMPKRLGANGLTALFRLTQLANAVGQVVETSRSFSIIGLVVGKNYRKPWILPSKNWVFPVSFPINQHLDSSRKNMRNLSLEIELAKFAALVDEAQLHKTFTCDLR